MNYEHRERVFDVAFSVGVLLYVLLRVSGVLP